MSKTYEALKKAEAERRRRDGEALKEDARHPDAQEARSAPEPAAPPASAAREAEAQPHLFQKDTQEEAQGESPQSPPVPPPSPTLSSVTPVAEQEENEGAVRSTENGHQNGHLLQVPRSVEEQYQRLYTRLVVRTQTPKPLQTFMVVGAHHGDGVTTSASLFARALARSRSVLLVDANLRTPALADVFNVRENRGFADFMARKVSLDGAITETEVPNLFIMTSGAAPLSPPYLFEAGPFEELLSGLKEKFDYIVFDAAPLGWHLDSTFLASRVDGVILVIKAESTQVELGMDIKKRLEEVGARVLGVVVNRAQDFVPKALRKVLLG